MSGSNDTATPPMFNVQIDGVWHQFRKGTRVIEACAQAGVYVPRYCYHKKLSSPGNCRMCLIEMGMPRMGPDRKPDLGADGKPVINWMPRPQICCAQDVAEGMGVRTNSPLTQECRRGVMEFLLINHPLDWPVCDQAGECDLQDLSYEHGGEGTRYEFKRRTFERHNLGPYIQLHMTRCILCFRCVFAADQLTNRRLHGILDRGDHSEIATYIAKSLENDFIGNIIDVCPVGALTDRTFRFKNRVWFTKPVEAHRDCPTCSGYVRLWMRGDEVFRVTARKDEWGEIKDTPDGKPGWICNTCRFEKKNASDWVIEGPTNVSRQSVISANKYKELKKPDETFEKLMHGRKPRIFMDIHDVSEVKKPNINLSLIEG